MLALVLSLSVFASPRTFARTLPSVERHEVYQTARRLWPTATRAELHTVVDRIVTAGAGAGGASGAAEVRLLANRLVVVLREALADHARGRLLRPATLDEVTYLMLRAALASATHTPTHRARVIRTMQHLAHHGMLSMVVFSANLVAHYHDPVLDTALESPKLLIWAMLAIAAAVTYEKAASSDHARNLPTLPMDPLARSEDAREELDAFYATIARGLKKEPAWARHYDDRQPRRIPHALIGLISEVWSAGQLKATCGSYLYPAPQP